MFKVLIPAAAALGLAAFAAHTHGGDALAPATAPMAWHLSHEGEIAKLAYGVANSDQLAVMLTCAPGDRSAVVYGDVQPRGARLLRASLTTLDPLSGGDAVEARIGLDDAALRGLAERGRMPVTGEAGDGVLTAAANERRLAAQFLSYCGMTRA